MFAISREPRQNEQRQEQRSRVLKGGTLSFNRGYGALECVVRNVSAHGAKLSFGETGAVPQQFSLRIGPDGEWRQAEVRWRGMTEVGVSLT
jgi:hypothetical protein